MKRVRMVLFGAAFILFPAFSGSAYALDVAVDAHGGTLGVGVGATLGLTRHFNARFGINGGELGDNFEEDGLEYKAEFEFDNKYLFLDWHPFRRSNLRLTAGWVLNDTRFIGSATIVSPVDIGNVSISSGGAETTVSFDSNSTYYGIGWGNAVGRDKRIGFNIDLGVLMQGEPTVDLTVTDPTGLVTEQDVELERQSIADELDGLDVFPVISIGLSYHF